MARSWVRSRISWRTWASRRPAAPFMLTFVHILSLVLAVLLLLALLTGCIATPTPPHLFGGMVYRLPTLPPAPLGITAGPDGAVWFADAYSIGRITPSGTISTFPLPRPTPTPADPSGLLVPVPDSMTLGPDGAVWFTDRGTDQIGRITTAGVVTEFALSPRFSAITQVITAGPDGALWFTRASGRIGEGEAGDAIGRITTGGTITLFDLPTRASPHGITTGPDGALWFTGAGAIGRMTTSGTIREFPIPYQGSGGPWGIVAGPDHALWFTERWGPILGRVTVSGDFTDLGVATSSGGGEAPPQTDDAREIIVGPDGNLWVAEHSLPAIEQFVVAPPPTPTQ